MKDFVKAEFDKEFPKAITTLTKAEKVTKETLRELSRTVLQAHHATEDVSYINKTIAALSPVNRKVAILYFTEFSGFREEQGQFVKKDKAKYDQAKGATLAFLEDPMNNIWSWAEREVDVSAKEFDISMVTSTVQKLLKKAKDANIGQADVLRAMFKAGFDVDALMAVMGEMSGDKEQA